jgi:hypothetical protein
MVRGLLPPLRRQWIPLPASSAHPQWLAAPRQLLMVLENQA